MVIIRIISEDVLSINGVRYNRLRTVDGAYTKEKKIRLYMRQYRRQRALMRQPVTRSI